MSQENNDCDDSVGNLNTGSRKKPKVGRLRERLKHKKYEDTDPLALKVSVCCKHKEGSKFKCKKIPQNRIVENRALLFKNKGKVQQDIYLTRLIAPYETLRKRITPPTSKPKPRKYSCTYFLVGSKKNMVQVCKKMFMSVFSLKSFRLRTITKLVFEGKIPKENRGGDHKWKNFVSKKQSVSNFIKNIPAKESHYNRLKSKRVYISSELSVRKLHQFYNNSVDNDMKVKYYMFRDIFNSKFNIGFSSPASDVCGFCILMSNKIKSENNPTKKQMLLTEKRIHKLRANKFYELARAAPEKSITFCFDLQQVLPLPRTPIQDAFYSRQVSFYNLCMVDMASKSPTFFSWTECDTGRGSTEVGSALISYLCSLDYENIEIVRLFCDGCGGQNKNSHVIHVLIHWLYNHAPVHVKKIQIHFPVRGHSFLPADRVFGRLEKEMSKHSVITRKEQYIEIISKFGKVLLLGKDWKLYDVKKLSENYRKIPQIQNLKRIYIEKNENSRRSSIQKECLLHLHEHYIFETESSGLSLLKRNKSYHTLLMEKPLGRELASAKKMDVQNLLEKQFGDSWKTEPQLKWYVDILQTATASIHDAEDEFDETENECNCMEPDSQVLRV